MKYVITILFIALLGACQVSSPTNVTARTILPADSVPTEPICVVWGWKTILIGEYRVEVPVCLRWEPEIA